MTHPRAVPRVALPVSRQDLRFSSIMWTVLSVSNVAALLLVATRKLPSSTMLVRGESDTQRDGAGRFIQGLFRIR